MEKTINKDRREKNRIYMRGQYYKRKRYFIDLLGGKCKWCGEDNIKELEFDHEDPERKETTITNILSYKIEKAQREISKCQLLCKKCHKEKNKVDNGEAKHGTYTMYKHHRCRCRPCMDSFNVARKKWRATARAKGKIW